MSLTLARTYVSSANTTTYTTTAFTPAAGDLLVVFAVATATTAAGGCTGSAGLTFTQITHAHKAAGADTLYAYVADQLTTAVSQTVTVTTTGDAASGCAITVVRVSGSNLAGIAAIRQSAVQDNRTAGGTPAPVFPALPLTTSACLGFVANGTSPATMSPPAGWTEGADIGFSNPTAGAEVCWAASGVIGTTVTWATASATAFGAIIVELATGSQAGLASATGSAPQVTIYAVPMSIVAGLGTGTAYGVTASTSAAPVEWGEWSQTWSNTVGSATAAYPGVAEGFGAANAPTNFANAGLAEATGIAGPLAPNAPTVAASGDAGAPLPWVQPNAGLPAATGASYDVTSKTSGRKYVDAPTAQATGTAGTAATAVTVNASAATASGAAGAATASVAPNAGVAAGSGEASPITAPGQAPAGLAEGTGAAYDLAAEYAPAGLAEGAGAAYAPITGGQTAAGLAEATGAAESVTARIAAAAGTAAGTGDAYGIAAPNVATAGVAAATGTAYDVRIGSTGGTPPWGKGGHHRPRGEAAHPVPAGAASHPTPEA
jgi:hypothetical protein